LKVCATGSAGSGTEQAEELAREITNKDWRNAYSGACGNFCLRGCRVVFSGSLYE